MQKIKTHFRYLIVVASLVAMAGLLLPGRALAAGDPFIYEQQPTCRDGDPMVFEQTVAGGANSASPNTQLVTGHSNFSGPAVFGNCLHVGNDGGVTAALAPPGQGAQAANGAARCAIPPGWENRVDTTERIVVTARGFGIFCYWTNAGDVSQGDATLAAGSGVTGGGVTGEAPTCNAKGTSNVCHNVIISKYIQPAINFLGIGFGLLVTITVVWAGIQYSMAGGDAQKVATAKGRVQNAVLSMVIFGFMYAFLQWVVPGGLFDT